MTVEEKALIWARRQKGNVLNNKNVDCFIAGYNTAAKEYKEIIDKGYKEALISLADKLEKQIEDDEVVLGIADFCFPIQIGLLGRNQRIVHYEML